jgi:DNA (cytosine-5)-methyltransferase 1
MKPRLLDLFCGAGGCSVGYERAGFEVVGVDIAPQRHYPFRFFQHDAIDFLRSRPLSAFDAIHASPPCQDHMETPHLEHGTGWLLAETRKLLMEIGKPWVIENVPNRRKQHMRPDYVLCGCMFGLPGLRRERWFETSWRGFALALDHNHTDPTISVVGHGTPSWVREKLGRNPTIHEYRAAMGIDWMNRNELSQAIPPAYTELIGHQLLQHIERRPRAGEALPPTLEKAL